MEHDGNVSVAVPRYKGTGKYLIVKRSESETSSGLWSFPGGMVEQGESIREAALRELQEETGLEADIVDSTGDFFWGGNVGDFRIYGFLAEVESRNVELNHEHSDYSWIEMDELENYETVGELKVLDKLNLR